jgi:hypothetical protein
MSRAAAPVDERAGRLRRRFQLDVEQGAGDLRGAHDAARRPDDGTHHRVEGRAAEVGDESADITEAETALADARRWRTRW